MNHLSYGRLQKFAKNILQQTNMLKKTLSDHAAFKKVLDESKSIIALTGAGVSAESGIPVFRGPGGWWRNHRAVELASPEAFRANPSLVWEFYHYRRDVVFKSSPNDAHIALAQYEEKCIKEGRKFTIITQNVDGLHYRAGSREVIELHGSLSKVKCTKCGFIDVNTENPICEALRFRGDPTAKQSDLPPIPTKDLPKCSKCQSLVRPHIVWFGEQLHPDTLNKAMALVETCDLCLLIGTSSVVYPAAMFAPRVVERGKPVAEFNITEEPNNDDFRFYFPGPCGKTLPQALGLQSEELAYKENMDTI